MQQGGADIVPVRLKNAVLRILARSKYRQYYLQQPAAAAAAAAGGAGPGTPPQGTPQYGGPSPPLKEYSPFGRLPPAAQPALAGPETTAFSHPGNMFGLMVCGSVAPVWMHGSLFQVLGPPVGICTRFLTLGSREYVIS